MKTICLLGVVLLAASLLNAANFSNATFKGTYALGFSGTDLTIGPIAGTGLLISDGEGGLTGSQTINDGGIVCDENLSGNYSIDADGTGSGSLTVESTSGGGICEAAVGNVVTFSLVLAGNGRSLRLSETNSNYVILATAQRQ